MPQAVPILTNFGAGELSARLDGRVDLQQYYQGCRVLENMILNEYGTVERDPGNYHVAEVKTSSKKVRLVPFEKDAATAYVLEFGDTYIRFYRNHVQLGAPYEVTTPYAEADLFQLKFAQKEGTLWIVHPSYAPRTLTCTSDTSWTLSTPTINGFDDTGVKTITGATQANPVVITAVAHGFSNGDIVLIKNVVGMYEVNVGVYKVAGAVTDTFQLSGINGTAFHTYISGGTVGKRKAIFASAGKYPSCLAFFEGRLFFGLNQTIYGSKSNDVLDFSIGTNDGDGLEYGMPTKSIIRWLEAKSDIGIGTNGGEWILSGGGAPITPTNVMLKKQSSYGSADIQAVPVNESVFYIQKGGKRVRQYIYNRDVDSFVSPDLTYFADHITESGLTCAALQQNPNTIFWAVRTDGVLIGLTFDTQYKVMGWHRHVYDGVIESIAIIPSTEDEIWISILRTIDGVEKRYIEYFKPRDWGAEQEDCFFVDSGLTYDGGAEKVISGATQADPIVITATSHSFLNDELVRIKNVTGMTELNGKVYMVKNKTTHTLELYLEDGTDGIVGTGFTAYVSGGVIEKVYKTLTGLSHLEAKTVSILADGAVQPDSVVTSGTVTLKYHANKVHVGIPYSSTLQPMRLEAGAADGTAQGRKKRVHKLTVRFYKTLGCKAGPDLDHLETMPFRLASDLMGTPTEIYNGDKSMAFPGPYDEDGNIVIVQDQPLPLGVIAIIPKVTTND